MATSITDTSIFIGANEKAEPQSLLLKRANRHGIIAGATGTGKTVTLQIFAEAFSKAGVPVFAADVKGDLSGVAVAGSDAHKLHEKLISRSEKINLEDYSYDSMPTTFWDLYGEQGHPIRTTITEMGPVLLSRLLDCTDAQEGIINIIFEVADDEGMLLLDLKDLRSMLHFVGEHRKELSIKYGNVTTQSVGAVQRKLLVLERQGAEMFFGEPALELADMMRTDDQGRGMINILASDKLINSPRLYATFLLWLLSELFEELPEVGDPDKPKLVFFFDEAHLLFDDAPDALISKVEQVARLIRSKGVGVFFVTQNPRDVPDSVLGQLGNRIQHALRAYTPSEQKAVKAAAGSFRPNPDLDTEKVITDLGVGEALVSTLDEKGAPGMVQRTLIRPPASRLGPATMKERKAVMADSAMGSKYDEMIDRESAFESLEKRAEKAAKAAEKEEQAEAKSKTSKSRSKTTKKESGFMKEIKKAAKRQVTTVTGRRELARWGRGLLGILIKSNSR